MTAKMTAVVIGLLVTALPAATPATAETLGEVLARHDVQTTAGPALDRAITGCGMLDDPAVFCIAFYWQSGTESLARELQVLAIDRSSGESRYATVVYGELIPDDPDFRTGAITRIMASPGYFYLGGHNSPSAGSVLVLSRKLVFQTALSADLYSNETPPPATRVVYVFRGIQQGPIEYREIVESQLAGRAGANNLAELLDPRVLNRVFP